MPHQIHQRKFGRETNHRRAMLRNLALAVLRYERVKTTEAKAKEVRRFVERMIGLGKDGSLAARRRARAFLPEPEIVEKVFADLAARYPDRSSGYVRIVHVGRRVGDSAPMMLIELTPGREETAAPVEQAEAERKPRRRLSLRRQRAEPEAKDAAAALVGKRARAGAKKTATKKTATAKGA